MKDIQPLQKKQKRRKQRFIGEMKPDFATTVSMDEVMHHVERLLQ
jgi:hypothetical protein